MDSLSSYLTEEYGRGFSRSNVAGMRQFYMAYKDREDEIIQSGIGCCTSLSSLVIPDSVTGIGKGIFSGCSSLCSLVIPDSVTSIGDSAFYGCTSLHNLVIPVGVTSIGDRAFRGWDGELMCLSPYFIYENNVLFDKDKSKILSFRDTKTSSYVIPDSVTSIGNSAFYGCSSLSSIVIPDSVTSIGDSAFYGCSSLSNLIIPDSVTSIGDSAFIYCHSLRNLVIPANVTSVEDGAFQVPDIPLIYR